MELIPQDDGWVLPAAGELVTRCCVENAAVRILCQSMLEISIEEPFTLVTPDGHSHALDPDPGGNPMDLAPILRIVRQVIQEGIAFKDGRLLLVFGDDSRIDVPSGQDFEAWNIAGPGGPEGLKIVSVPGGELAIWSDRRQGER
jgi:hypothetical protein